MVMGAASHREWARIRSYLGWTSRSSHRLRTNSRDNQMPRLVTTIRCLKSGAGLAHSTWNDPLTAQVQAAAQRTCISRPRSEWIRPPRLSTTVHTLLESFGLQSDGNKRKKLAWEQEKIACLGTTTGARTPPPREVLRRSNHENITKRKRDDGKPESGTPVLSAKCTPRFDMNIWNVSNH